MPVPRRKTSRQKRDTRRSHQHLARPQVQNCKRCGSPRLAHCVCKACGYLGDKEVLRIAEK